MVLADMSVRDLAKQMDCPKSTLYRKFKNPKKLTVEEMEKMSAILGITDIKDVFFDSK
jgi:AcrR family transcriptional regulator